MNAEFVCFYDVNLNGSRTAQIYQAYNGFSTLGDVSVKWINTLKLDEFIPDSNKVFVSCHYHDHIEAVFNWADKYQDTSFVAGGCLFGTHRLRSTVTRIPKNVIITADSLQTYFNAPQKRWHMSFPYNDKELRYTFGNGTTCYWQKCNFCIATYRDGRPYKSCSYDYDALKDAPAGRVYLSNPSIPGVELRDIIPVLSDYKQYFTLFIRSGEQELKALKNVDCDWKKFHFLIGIEFPSERMLKLMNKGVTLKECEDMITFLQSKGAGFALYMIYDWPDLLKKDLVDARRFLDIVNKKVNFIYRPLHDIEEVGEIDGWKDLKNANRL